MKNRNISVLLALFLLISVFNIVINGEESRETFCYNVPDTVRSLSIVKNGYFTAAAGVGEDPDIFIYDLDGVKWACLKRALAIILSPDGRYTVVGMNNGFELYDNARAVDISKSINEDIIVTQEYYYNPFAHDPDCNGPMCGWLPRDVVSTITSETTYNTCNPLWKYTTDAETRVLAISDTGSYIVAGAGDMLYVVNKQGQLLWKYKSDGLIKYIKIQGSFVGVASDKTVYLFKTNGDLIWSFSVTGVPNILDITSTGPYLAIGTDTGNIYFIDPNGKSLWQYKNKASIRAISVTKLGSYIAAGSKDGHVLYFNKNGEKLWDYETNGEVGALDLASQGQFVGVGADDDAYYLFNWNGQKLWSKTNPDKYYWALHIADNGYWLLAGSSKYMGGSDEMMIDSTVCYFITQKYAIPGEQPDKNTEVQTTTPETTTSAANKFPLANAGTDLEAKVGDAIHFDGTKSIDEDGNIVAYKWDFGDGTSSNDAEPLHQYANPGTYKVTLTVTDNKGDTGQDVLYTTVKSAEPQSPIKGVPGFELPAVLGGSAFAYYLLSRRKKKY